MAIYPAHCENCGDVEISKPMADDFPARHTCGHILRRRFEPTAVHYAAAGFYKTDVDHFKNQIGPERFARFEADRAAGIQRQQSGTLTPYERELERV